MINVQTTRFNTWLTLRTENESTQVKAIPIGSDDDRNRPNDIIVVDGSQRQTAATTTTRSRRRRRSNNDSDEVDDDEEEEDENEDEEIDEEERIFIDPGYSDLDIKELYLKLIFEPYRFSKSNMIKSLGV